MKDKFPYPGEPAVITNEMCDLNGHLNVVYYYHIFAQDFGGFYEDMGFTSEYFEKGFSSFTLETNLNYLKEIKEGEKCCPHYRMINVSPKLIHYGGILLTEEGEVSATYETVEVHIDMSTRKSSEMPDSFLSNLNTMKDEHSQAGGPGFELRLKIK
jgi:acyl-CoA thioester hydrolase|tara:strand:+ start:948 stop:1415 length:468 start_codon:yes stop_codon:yes gene_type:complete